MKKDLRLKTREYYPPFTLRVLLVSCLCFLCRLLLLLYEVELKWLIGEPAESPEEKC